MDREIPQKERRRKLYKQLAKVVLTVLVAATGIGILIGQVQTRVNRKDLTVSTVDTGMVEVSVSASGIVLPAFEEIINTPIHSRILEVYCKGGDSVDVGTPILKLDLQSTETAYKKLLDEQQMRRYQLDQLKVDTRTKLSDMSMQIKVSAMKLNRMKVELRNEHYLDSLGAGTTDKVRQAELSYNVAQLEYEQLCHRYENEKQVADASLKVKELDYNIFCKGLEETKRTLEDARIRSPRKAILTFINNQVGAQVAAGSQVAVISDLSHFKVGGEIADSYADKVQAGNRAVVKVGRVTLPGRVSSVTPLSKNGVVSFDVQLEEDAHKLLRSGLKTDVYVLHSIRDNVLRIANGPYYRGPGKYPLFVLDGESTLIRKEVDLGESNYEYVEVIAGLKPGEQAVTSDMVNFKDREMLKLR